MLKVKSDKARILLLDYDVTQQSVNLKAFTSINFMLQNNQQ